MMRDVLVISTILAGSFANVWLTGIWWRRYRDLRAIRALVMAILLFLGALALAAATWALNEQRTPEEVIVLVRFLVSLGQGAFLAFLGFLVLSVYRERGRA